MYSRFSKYSFVGEHILQFVRLIALGWPSDRRSLVVIDSLLHQVVHVHRLFCIHNFWRVDTSKEQRPTNCCSLCSVGKRWFFRQFVAIVRENHIWWYDKRTSKCGCICFDCLKLPVLESTIQQYCYAPKSGLVHELRTPFGQHFLQLLFQANNVWWNFSRKSLSPAALAMVPHFVQRFAIMMEQIR